MNGHWSRTCRTSKHLVDLYQASLNGKGKETNFVDHNNFLDSFDGVDVTHLDISDFFEDPTGKIDHLIGDRNVIIN